jgi:putative transposase
VVGVDLGLTTLATGSDGPAVATPRHLQRRLKTITRQHRVVSRRHQGSQNRQQAVRRLGRLYRRVAHQRANTLHQRTTRLANTKAALVLAELHVAGMLTNHHLAQAIADVGLSEFRRHLRYKAAWGWYPSSKTCSGCGWVDADLTLADRLFRCRTPSSRRARWCSTAI